MRKSSWSIQKIFEFSAYISTGLIAIALMFAEIFGANGSIANAFESVGQASAYIVTMIVAGLFVKRKTHPAWLICYVIFVVAIVVLYVLGIVL